MKEITDLRQTLNGEVEALRTDFMDLRTSLKQQLGAKERTMWSCECALALVCMQTTRFIPKTNLLDT